MSLINDMLKDLESRRAGSDQATRGAEVGDLQAPPRSTGRWAAVGAAALVVVLAGAGLWLGLRWISNAQGTAATGSTSQTAAVPPQAPAQTTADADPAPGKDHEPAVATAPAPPGTNPQEATAVTAAELVETTSGVRLDLTVDGAVDYSLSRGQQTLTLGLKGARQAAGWQPPAPVGPVDAVRVEQDGHRWLLGLSLEGPVRVAGSSLGPADSAGRRRLRIAVRSQEASSTPSAGSASGPAVAETKGTGSTADGGKDQVPPAAQPTPAPRPASRQASQPTDAAPATAAGTGQNETDGPPRTPEPPSGDGGRDAAPVVEKQARAYSAESEAERAMRAAHEALEAGRIRQAARHLEQALRHQPDHVGARRRLALLLIRQQETVRARNLLAKGLEARPREPDLAEPYARLLMAEGRLSQALALLQRAAPPMAQRPRYHALLALLHRRLGHYERATSVYRALVRVRPGQGVWWMGLGLSLEGRQQANKALAAYQRAAEAGGLSDEVARYVRERIEALSGAAPRG